MILVLDCKDGYEEFLNIVTEESFPICDIDAFLSSVIHTVFTPDESAEALMNDMGLRCLLNYSKKKSIL